MNYRDLKVGQVLRYRSNLVRSGLLVVQVTSIGEFEDFNAIILKDTMYMYQEGTTEDNFAPEYFEIYNS